MGYDSKYGLVTTEHGDIPADEQVVVFRARDLGILSAVEGYARWAQEHRGVVSKEHRELINKTLRELRNWQELHKDRLRWPSSTGYLQRTQEA